MTVSELNRNCHKANPAATAAVPPRPHQAGQARSRRGALAVSSAAASPAAAGSAAGPDPAGREPAWPVRPLAPGSARGQFPGT